MATTSNYGWTTPDDNSLVKDGASAIRTLGSAIDTSLNTALGTKKAGMVLLNTTSFSGVASVSLPAATFSSTYRNYRIVLSADTTVATQMQIRLRVGGADNTTSNYYSGAVNVAMVGGAVTGDPGGAAGNIMSRAGYSNSAGVLNMFYDIYNPFETKATGISATQARNDAVLTIVGGYFQATTSFDSLTFIPASGNITGEVSVYGYNK